MLSLLFWAMICAFVNFLMKTNPSGQTDLLQMVPKLGGREHVSAESSSGSRETKTQSLSSSQASKCADSWIIPLMTVLTEYSGSLFQLLPTALWSEQSAPLLANKPSLALFGPCHLSTGWLQALQFVFLCPIPHPSGSFSLLLPAWSFWSINLAMQISLLKSFRGSPKENGQPLRSNLWWTWPLQRQFCASQIHSLLWISYLHFPTCVLAHDTVLISDALLYTLVLSLKMENLEVISINLYLNPIGYNKVT